MLLLTPDDLAAVAEPDRGADARRALDQAAITPPCTMPYGWCSAGVTSAVMTTRSLGDLAVAKAQGLVQSHVRDRHRAPPVGLCPDPIGPVASLGRAPLPGTVAPSPIADLGADAWRFAGSPSSVGLLVLLSTTFSVVGTLVVPRGIDSLISQACERFVDATFVLITRRVRTYLRRDRILAWQGPVGLLLRLGVWIALIVVGFALVLMPVVPRHPGALVQRGGFLDVHPRLLGADQREQHGDRLRRGVHRTGRRRPADRIPAHAVLGVQPPRDRGDAADLARRSAGVGTGDPRPDPVRHRRRGRGSGARQAVRQLGAMVRRGGRVAHHLSRPGPVPVAHGRCRTG